jgi:DnaJ-class molecular chaperone
VDDEEPTLKVSQPMVQCPRCHGQGNKKISGSFDLKKTGLWEYDKCRLCLGKGKVTILEADFYIRRHDTPVERPKK